MTILEWVIQDTRRKIAAEEGDAAAVPPAAAASSPISIRGTIDATPGRGGADGSVVCQRTREAARERYHARKAGQV